MKQTPTLYDLPISNRTPFKWTGTRPGQNPVTCQDHNSKSTWSIGLNFLPVIKDTYYFKKPPFLEHELEHELEHQVDVDVDHDVLPDLDLGAQK